MTQHVMLSHGRKFERYEGLAMFKHDGGGIHLANKEKHYQEDKKQFYGKRRVLLLVRHPLDVCVSGWHLLRHRMKQKRYQNWTLDQYLQLDRGLPFLVRWMNDWARQTEVPVDFRMFTYEMFLQDPAGQLQRFVKWVGLDVDEERCFKAVETFNFDNMVAHDKHFLMPGIDGEIGQTLDREDRSSYAVRKGRADNWRKELSVEVQAWGIDYLKENLHPMYDMYKHDELTREETEQREADEEASGVVENHTS
jgi:hypothetical protein